MASEKELALANEVFKKLCNMLDRDQMKYGKNEENKFVFLESIKSEKNIDINMQIQIDADLQIIRILSPMPVLINEKYFPDFLAAASTVSNFLGDGCFDVIFDKHLIVFRLSSCFCESIVGDGVFKYLISSAKTCIENYYDNFLALNDGMGFENFVKSL